LSFKKGDRLLIKNQLSTDWWHGALDDGKSGYIPDKYIALKYIKRQVDRAQFVCHQFSLIACSYFFYRKGSNISYDFDFSKNNLSDLLEKSKESDILSDEKAKDENQMLGVVDGNTELQKQKMSYIEQALTTVLNDMTKEFDLNNSFETNDKNARGYNDNDDDDYDEPPEDDECQEDNLKNSSSNEILSTTSSSTSPVFGDVELVIDHEPRPLRKEEKIVSHWSPNTCGSPSSIINRKSLSDRPDLVIDLPLNERNQTSAYESLGRKQNGCNVQMKVQQLIKQTDQFMDNLSFSQKRSPNRDSVNLVKSTKETSTPMRMESFANKTSPFKTNTIEYTQAIVKKQPPPIIAKKPDKSDEILRRLNQTPDSKTSAQLAKNKATDV
jgi:hypothetical protein